jgi:hypothetical protein
VSIGEVFSWWCPPYRRALISIRARKISCVFILSPCFDFILYDVVVDAVSPFYVVQGFPELDDFSLHYASLASRYEASGSAQILGCAYLCFHWAFLLPVAVKDGFCWLKTASPVPVAEN